MDTPQRLARTSLNRTALLSTSDANVATSSSSADIDTTSFHVGSGSHPTGDLSFAPDAVTVCNSPTHNIADRISMKRERERKEGSTAGPMHIEEQQNRGRHTSNVGRVFAT